MPNLKTKRRKHKLFCKCNKGDSELNRREAKAHKCTRETGKAREGNRKLVVFNGDGADFLAQPGH